MDVAEEGSASGSKGSGSSRCEYKSGGEKGKPYNSHPKQSKIFSSHRHHPLLPKSSPIVSSVFTGQFSHPPLDRTAADHNDSSCWESPRKEGSRCGSGWVSRRRFILFLDMPLGCLISRCNVRSIIRSWGGDF